MNPSEFMEKILRELCSYGINDDIENQARLESLDSALKCYYRLRTYWEDLMGAKETSELTKDPRAIRYKRFYLGEYNYDPGEIETDEKSAKEDLKSMVKFMLENQDALMEAAQERLEETANALDRIIRDDGELNQYRWAIERWDEKAEEINAIRGSIGLGEREETPQQKARRENWLKWERKYLKTSEGRIKASKEMLGKLPMDLTPETDRTQAIFTLSDPIFNIFNSQFPLSQYFIIDVEKQIAGMAHLLVDQNEICELVDVTGLDEKIIETACALYDPHSKGPYRSLRAAFQAAKNLES